MLWIRGDIHSVSRERAREFNQRECYGRDSMTGAPPKSEKGNNRAEATKPNTPASFGNGERVVDLIYLSALLSPSFYTGYLVVF